MTEPRHNVFASAQIRIADLVREHQHKQWVTINVEGGESIRMSMATLKQLTDKVDRQDRERCALASALRPYLPK